MTTSKNGVFGGRIFAKSLERESTGRDANLAITLMRKNFMEDLIMKRYWYRLETSDMVTRLWSDVVGPDRCFFNYMRSDGTRYIQGTLTIFEATLIRILIRLDRKHYILVRVDDKD